MSEVVTPDKLFSIIESTGYKIVDFYLDAGLTLEEAFNEFENFTDFLGPLEVGQRSYFRYVLFKQTTKY